MNKSTIELLQRIGIAIGIFWIIILVIGIIKTIFVK